MEKPEPASRFTFGVFELDVRAGELRKRGARVRLNGQPLQILVALLARAGDVVSRDELRQQLWPGDTFVEFDHSLNTAVKRLREALGDDASTPRFIETIPRRGYRFVAPVDRATSPGVDGAGSDIAGAAIHAPASAQPLHARRAGRGRRILVTSGLTLAAIAAAFVFIVWQRPSPPEAAAVESRRLRLAVLPFTNLTGDAGRQYVAEGLTEELVSQLGRLAPGRLAVIARSSTTWPDGARPPLREIARALQVDYVIEGSVRSVDDRYRIAARLVDTKALSTVWSELYEGPILELDERLAEAHCALGDVLSTTRDMSGAEREFLRALALNPSHSASYERYAWHLTRVNRADEARALIERARALAPRSADVATTAAYFELASGRLESAAALSRAALNYEPDYPFARYVLGRIALRRDAPAVAIDEFSRARFASRDAPKYLAALADAYLSAGRIDDARRTVGELRTIARTRYVPPDMIERLDERVAATAGIGS